MNRQNTDGGIPVTLTLKEDRLNELIRFCSGTKLNPQALLSDMVSENMDNWLLWMEPLKQAVPATYLKEMEISTEEGKIEVRKVQVKCLACTNVDTFIAGERYYRVYAGGKFIYVPVRLITLEKDKETC